jgi:hypothetical protein
MPHRRSRDIISAVKVELPSSGRVVGVNVGAPLDVGIALTAVTLQGRRCFSGSHRQWAQCLAFVMVAPRWSPYPVSAVPLLMFV